MRERQTDHVVFSDDAVSVSQCMENADHVINIESDDEPWGVNVGIGGSEPEAIDDALGRLRKIATALRRRRNVTQ